MNFSLLYPWIDLFWVPAAFLLTKRRKWLVMTGFILACALVLRLQVELLEEGGFAHGILGLMEMDLLRRGQIVYSFFIGIFLLMGRYSPGINRNILVAAAITIFFAGFCISSVIMVL